MRVAIRQRDLDAGEAEAIGLALQKHADWLLLDERDARRVAKSLGLKVTGVLGILLKASMDGQLPSWREAMGHCAILPNFGSAWRSIPNFYELQENSEDIHFTRYPISPSASTTIS